MEAEGFTKLALLLERIADDISELNLGVAKGTFRPHRSTSNDGGDDGMDFSRIGNQRRAVLFMRSRLDCGNTRARGRGRTHHRLDFKLTSQPFFEHGPARLGHRRKLDSCQVAPLPDLDSGDLDASPSDFERKENLQRSVQRTI